MKRALLLVDHGSRRTAANETLAQVAELVRAEAPDLLHVAAAHMELATPTLADGLRECVEAGAEEVTVVPYFLTPGRHATEDIPTMTAEAAAEYPSVTVTVAEPLGVHPLLAQLVLARATR